MTAIFSLIGNVIRSLMIIAGLGIGAICVVTMIGIVGFGDRTVQQAERKVDDRPAAIVAATAKPTKVVPPEPKPVVKARTEVRPGDTASARMIGKMLLDQGFITKYDTDTSVLSDYRHLNLHISSLLPGEARQIAQVVCQQAKRLHQFEMVWHVQVFIATGSSAPAGRCRI